MLLHAASVNHMRVHRSAQRQTLLLARRHTKRRNSTDNGTALTLCSHYNWCSDGFESACWNGEILRSARIVDAS